MDQFAHIAAHRFSSNHREQVLSSETCGCFYCLEVFPPSEIEEWVDPDDFDSDGPEGLGKTAICPRCGIDSVIGSNSGVALTHELLEKMRIHWFS